MTLALSRSIFWLPGLTVGLLVACSGPGRLPDISRASGAGARGRTGTGSGGGSGTVLSDRDRYRVADDKAQPRRPAAKRRAPLPKCRYGDPEARYRVDVTARPRQGPADAPVTISIFNDFQCPWCKRSAPQLDQLIKAFGRNLRLFWHDFPLSFHQQAMNAAVLGRTVFRYRGHSAFWQYVQLVFGAMGRLTRAQLRGFARQLGVTPAQIAGALTDPTQREKIVAARHAAGMIGVVGTPTILINGKAFGGRRDLPRMTKVINAELAAFRKSGVRRSGYYAHIQRSALTRKKCAADPPRATARPKLDPKAVYKVPVTGASPRLGPANALVTIVTAQDFQCPYCKWWSCVLRHVQRAYPRDVRVIWRNNPLSFHTKAMPAAEAAYAAFAQRGNRGFWAMHDRLFPSKHCSARTPMPPIRTWLRSLPRPSAQRLDRAHFMAAARAIGLNLRRFKADLDGHTQRTKIRTEQAYLVQLGATGTPAWFINGLRVRGARPFADVKVLVDGALAKARQLMRQRRLRRPQVYPAIIRNGATAPVYLP